MAIRVTLECGHVSMLRVRTTPEGYTHDWEVFVRGVNNADIHHYVEKVVFHLHETFPKPRRVLKEPPYIVKESGYAGFVIPIDVYLKNKDEPKKFQITYDLQLQPSGPAINNVLQHSEIISSPPDEFRRKLLKGGATIVPNAEGPSEKGEIKATPPMVGKPKLSGSETKKHRLMDPKSSTSFQDLFGTPIKTTDTKKVSPPDKAANSKTTPPVDKEKLDKLAKPKDAPHKEGKRDKGDDKKEKKNKDSSKERNRSKEKPKRPPSPGTKSHLSPGSKRPSTPPPGKKPPSPTIPSSLKRPASPRPKEKDGKKIALEKDKEKEKEKEKEKLKESNAPKVTLDASKGDKKKEKRRHKEDRDKEKREKHKEGSDSRNATKEIVKNVEVKKPEKVEKSEKIEREKVPEKSVKEDRKSPKSFKEGEKTKEDKVPKSDKTEKVEKTEKAEKVKDGKGEKERQKHKHKKKDKKEKRDSSKEREKKEKRDRSKNTTEVQSNSMTIPPSTKPLSALLAEMPERDSSDSAPSVDEESYNEPKLLTSKKDHEPKLASTVPAEPPRTMSPPLPVEMKKERNDKTKRDKLRGSKGDERENRKRKRRSDGKSEEEHLAKREKERGRSSSPLLEPVSSSQSPVAIEVDSMHSSKDKDNREPSEQTAEKVSEGESEQVAPDSTNSTLVESDISEPPIFSEDYVSQLKELQQKIMTLQDNQELQRVVQVIAETGQYEITKKTFDFDLCALDRRTVQRLQQFFSAS